MSAGEHALALIALAWQRLADTLQAELNMVRAERDRAVSRAEGLVLEIEATRAAAAAHGREPDEARDDLAAKLKAARNDYATLSDRHEDVLMALSAAVEERDAARRENNEQVEEVRREVEARMRRRVDEVLAGAGAAWQRAAAAEAALEKLREDWRREAAERAEVAEQQAAQLRGELRDAEAEIAELRKSLSAETAALAVSESQRLVEEYTAAARAAGEVSDG